VFRFLPNFATAKAAAYLAPLVLALFAPEDIYAATEFGYAVALPAVSLLIYAPIMGVSHRYLSTEKIDLNVQVALVIIGVMVLAFALAAVTLLMSLHWYIPMACAVAALTSYQLAQSVSLRALGRINLVVWADGLVPLSCVAIVLACRWTIGLSGEGVVLGLLVIGSLLLGNLLYRVRRETGWRLSQRHQLWLSAKAGLGMAAYAVLASWVIVSGRVFFGSLSPEDLASFGVAFRIVGLSYGLPQIALTALWSRIYRATAQECDGLLVWFIVGSAAAAALAAAGGQVLLDRARFEALDDAGVAAARTMLAPMAIFIFFCGAHSLLQPLVNRFGLAVKCVPAMALLFFGGTALFVLAVWLNFEAEALAWLLAIYAATYFGVVWATLHRAGIRLPLMGLAAASLGLFLILITKWL
jgi:hypothetical protein